MKNIIITTSLLAMSSVCVAQPVVDGTVDAAYGAPNAVQNTQTSFGNSDLGMPDFANGSEIGKAKEPKKYQFLLGERSHLKL